MIIRNRITSPQFSHSWTYTNVDHSISANHTLTLTKTGGVESFTELDGLDVSDCQGQSITIAASITSVSSDMHQCGNGIIWLMYSGISQTANLSTAPTDGLIQTGRQVLATTVPDGATLLNLRLYGPVEDGKTIQWWRPILCKTSEYQSMLSGQASGTPIDYMDGDIMPLAS